MEGDVGEIRQWLEDFSAAVRAVDYERGMTMFASDVVGFGTFASMLEGLEPLVAGQWRNIWGVTRGFTFRLEQLHCGIDGDLAWVAVPSDSQGQDATGDWYDRPGRATLGCRGATATGCASTRTCRSTPTGRPTWPLTRGHEVTRTWKGRPRMQVGIASSIWKGIADLPFPEYLAWAKRSGAGDD